jgi:ABC-type sugar transport system ATPase subunit
VSLAVHEGEVVGLAGLVGAGRSEILETIADLRALKAGRIERTARAFLVPEDRAVKGLVPSMVVRENVCLPADTSWLHLLLSSSDLPELLAVCDRIVCLYAGRIVADVAITETSEEQLATFITGVGQDPRGAALGVSRLLPPVSCLLP